MVMADCTSEKCNSGNIDVAGGEILLYAESKTLMDKIDQRSQLFQGLGSTLFEIDYSIICYPGAGIHNEDLKIIRKAMPNKPDASSVSYTPRTRSRSTSEVFDCPIPSAMITNDSARDNVIYKSAAWSAYGALSMLARTRKWNDAKIILVGINRVSVELYWLLTRESVEVYVADESDDLLDAEKIPQDKRISWDITMTTPCDILVPCGEIPSESTDSRYSSPGSPNVSSDNFNISRENAGKTISAEMVEKLECKSLVTLTDNLLPTNHDDREHTLFAFERKGIYDCCEGLIDVGSIAKAYSMAIRSDCTYDDCYELGRLVMQTQMHLENVVQQYDTEEKRRFYSQVMGDGTNNIHFGLWDGIDLAAVGSFGYASEKITQWMWEKAASMCPAHRTNARTIRYIDLGAGTGCAARWICGQDLRVKAKCVNICRNQNRENRTLSDEAGLGSQITVETGSFERLASEYANHFDGCFSQDSFIHAFNKDHAFAEAYRVTKGGGWFVSSDLMCGEGNDITDDELHSFGETNTVKDWATPSAVCKTMKSVGWCNVEFVDMSSHIKISFKRMLDKVDEMIENPTDPLLNIKLLNTYKINLTRRIGQMDRKVFRWGIVIARKPYSCLFLTQPPVNPDKNEMMNYSCSESNDAEVEFGVDVVAVTIKDKMPRSRIDTLPKTTRLIVAMSAGLDHIDQAAAEEKGIVVAQAAREPIVKSVADYLLSTIVFGLRNGFQNCGVPFPGKSWDLSWNSDGIDLHKSKIGFVGMGMIAKETVRRIRNLSHECDLVYSNAPGVRQSAVERDLDVRSIGMADLIATCDVIIPMVPYFDSTHNLFKYEDFRMMKPTCIFINMARGGIVDTDGLTKALQEKEIRHAVLDTTAPEPLPADHPLWNQKNCTITPHFATNTGYVRKELVEDIPRQIQDVLEGEGILRLEEERLRKDLSAAYAITREFGFDELVWNHLSVKLSDGSYLITPGRRMFDDITPADLVKSSSNVTADIIHDAVYKTRPDIKAIVHLHTPATVAVSCLADGFLPLAQESAYFVGSVGYHAWEGVSNDWDEQAHLGEAVKDPKINTLIMRNHGFCTFGKTIGEAWVLAYYFDKSCRTQLNVMQSGAKINLPDPAVLQVAHEQSFLPDFAPGVCEWDALKKMLLRK